MIITNTALFSDLFDDTVTLWTLTHPAYTDNSGNRVPAEYTQALDPIKVSLQDIIAERADKQLPAEYRKGDIYMFTSAAVKIGDRIKISENAWQIVEIVSEFRHVCPGRNKYLIRRVN